MAKSKNDLNIHFEGKTDGLVVKLNGKVIYPFKEEKVVKEISPNKLKTQLKAGVAAVFSGGVNRVIPLRETWKKWPVKSRIPYRNILAANIKRCTEEHPTKANIICPSSGLSFTMAESEMTAEGIKIEVGCTDGWIKIDEGKKGVSVVGILSLFNPREKDYEPLSIYPLNSPVADFSRKENIRAAFRFTEEMRVNISNYEKSILYYTVVLAGASGMTKWWFNGGTDEYLLNNDAEGKFQKGVLVR